MIILSEVQPYGFRLLEEIRKFNHSNKKVKVYTWYHGTFAKRTRNSRIYATDIDTDCWMYYQNNKEELLEHSLKIIDFLLKNKLYFDETILGEDERFKIDAYIEKNGEIKNYNASKIRKQFQKLTKDKIITKEDEKELLEYVIDTPTLISFEKFKQVLEKFMTIKWTRDELKKGYTTHYKKKFYLKNLFMNYVFRTSFIYEYKKGEYILFDIAFRVFDISEKYQNKLTEKEYDKLYILLNESAKIYANFDKTETIYLYYGIFKNYVQEKYLKMLKRIRSLLNVNYYNLTNDKELQKEENKKFIFNLKHKIKKIATSPELSCLNQLKNRCDIIVSLIEHKYKDELEIKRLVIELMKDAMYACKYESSDIKNVYDALETFHLKNSNNNKNKLIEAIKLFKKNMFHHLNMLALPHLIYFYNELKNKNLLVFDLVLPLPKS